MGYAVLFLYSSDSHPGVRVPPRYEPGHLGYTKKLNNGGTGTSLGYLFKITTYKFDITATILITNILVI